MVCLSLGVWADDITVNSFDFDTGGYSLSFPAQAKNAKLYFACGTDTSSGYSEWVNPVFLADIQSGVTAAASTVPGFDQEKMKRFKFVLVDPDEFAYVRKEYVQSAGNAMFMTDVTPDADWRIDVEFLMTQYDGYQRWLFCARKDAAGSASDMLCAFRGNQNNAIRFGYNTTANQTLGNNITTAVKYHATANANNFNIKTVEGGTTVGSYAFTACAGFTTCYKLGFGGSSSGGVADAEASCYPLYAKYYSFTVRDGSGELKGDFRPVTRNGVAGFLDIVSGNFYESCLSAAFTAADGSIELDTRTVDLGTPLAATVMLGSVASQAVAEDPNRQYALGGIPVYGELNAPIGEEITLSAPAVEFEWTADGGDGCRVKCRGVRVDVYDKSRGVFVTGQPQIGTTSFSWTRQTVFDAIRVVWLWDAVRDSAASRVLPVDSIRLVSGTINGWSTSNCGFFDTGIHPNPATTRVSFKVRMSAFDSNRNFFGVRQGNVAADQIASNFYLCKTSSTDIRFDLCGAVGNTYTTVGGICAAGDWLRFDILNGNAQYWNDTKSTASSVARKSNRTNVDLTPTLPIFGQMRYNNSGTGITEQSLDGNNTEYAYFKIWTNETVLARDYVACLDEQGKACFFDKVQKTTCYPNSDAATYEAAGAPTGRVVVTGEPAEYLPSEGDVYGSETLGTGIEKTYTIPLCSVFGYRVFGYRIDTWSNDGWQQGTVQHGRSVTLVGDDTNRRLVWVWSKSYGLSIIVR